MRAATIRSALADPGCEGQQEEKLRAFSKQGGACDEPILRCSIERGHLLRAEKEDHLRRDQRSETKDESQDDGDSAGCGRGQFAGNVQEDEDPDHSATANGHVRCYGMAKVGLSGRKHKETAPVFRCKNIGNMPRIGGSLCEKSFRGAEVADYPRKDQGGEKNCQNDPPKKSGIPACFV